MRVVLIFFIAFLVFYFNPIKAEINDYIYPHQKYSYSNYGGVGLIQNPTARFFKSGTLAVSLSHYDPYLRGSIIAYPFDWFEASYQYVEINNALYSSSKEFSGTQSLKDKSFDVKFKIINESNYLPQVAVGFRDIGGTGLFSSEYLVFNKFVSRNIDLSFGIGWGNLDSNEISNPLSKLSNRFESRNAEEGLGGKVNIDDLFSGDAGYFAGIEVFLPYLNGLRGKIEIDGTNYETESKVPLSQDSNINVGLIYPLNKDLDIKLSYARGNTLSFGFSYALGLGGKNPRKIKKESRIELRRPDIVKNITAKSDENIYKASLLYLSREKINLQKASIQDDQLHVVFAQSTYRSPAIAAGRAINILHQSAPEKIKSFKVSEINGGMGIYSLSIDRSAYDRYSRLNTPASLAIDIDSSGYYFIDKEEEFSFNPESNYPAFFYNLGPEIRSQIGGPDGFFFGDLKVKLVSELLLSRNLSLISSLSYGLYDNMDSLKLASDSVLPHVRTDIVKYLKQSRNFSIQRTQLNFYDQLSESLYYKVSGGVLESMFNGFGFEMLYRPYSKNFGVGLEAWKVWQRDYDQMFDTLSYTTTTGHLTLYYKEPRSGVLLKLKGGKYLAQDSGITVDFSREFISGLRVGAFFSLTDISADEFGEGSFDKGFYFWVPVGLFSSRYQKRNFGWGLRPITRDGAQYINHGYPLWGVTDNVSNNKLRKNLDDFFD